MSQENTPMPDRPATDYRCVWFALCPKMATHYEWHPVLQWLPACDRCPKIGR
jgi:hypothetical protein